MQISSRGSWSQSSRTKETAEETTEAVGIAEQAKRQK